MKKIILIAILVAVAAAFGWEKDERNPVLGPVVPWAWLALSDPDMISIPGGGFYLVYTAAGADTSTGVTLTRPGAAWSSDGFSWTMSDGPVITNGVTGTWDSAAVETPAVLYEGDSIIMVYAGERAHGGGQLAIGMAVSHDGGETYARVGGGPIFEKDTTRPEEGRSIESPSLIRVGDSLVMFYNGQSLDWKITVCRATSADGIEWHRYIGNPVLDIGEPGEFDDIAVYAPCVRRVWSGETLFMLYQGLTLGESTYAFDSTHLGAATSTDNGITWTRWSANPVLFPGPDGSWDEHGPMTPTFDIFGAGILGWYWNGGNDGLGIFTHDFTGIDEVRLPENYEIVSYPNPFNSALTIALRGAGAANSWDSAVGTPGVSATWSSGKAGGENYGRGAPASAAPLVWRPQNAVPSGIYMVRVRLDSEKPISSRVVYLK